MSTSRGRTFPPAPQPLPVAVPDSHTHLDMTITDGDSRDRDAVAREAEQVVGGPATVADAVAMAAAVGVDRLVQVGVDVSSSRWGASIAKAHRAVLATVAIHPNEAPRLADLDAALREIDALAGEDRVCGVGETGLDHFRTEEGGRGVQEESFRAHIDIAKRRGKALVIHDRDAHDDVLRVLAEAGAPDTVVMHCFSGDEDLAKECVRRGYVLSFAGTVTFASAGALRDAARVTPLDQMMVETDAPFLTPVPHRGRLNASYLIPLTVRALAEVKDVPVETLCTTLASTTERVFGPW